MITKKEFNNVLAGKKRKELLESLEVFIDKEIEKFIEGKKHRTDIRFKCRKENKSNYQEDDMDIMLREVEEYEKYPVLKKLADMYEKAGHDVHLFLDEDALFETYVFQIKDLKIPQ